MISSSHILDKMAEDSSSESHKNRLTIDEMEIMEKRRKYIIEYIPPRWKSSHIDVVSGQAHEVPMVTRTSMFSL